MAQFKYQAKNATGQPVSGVMEADSPITLRAILREKDLYLVTVVENKSKKSEAGSARKKIVAKDLAVICKQLSSMLQAGVTLIRSLDILYQQMENKALKSILRTIYEDVQKGDMFSDALKKQGNRFPPLMISIIESGEASGTMDEVIGKLANQFDGDSKIHTKIVSALIYPIVLLILVIVAIIAMLVFVLPTFVGMYEGSDVELPFITNMVMGASDFLVANWYIILAIVSVLILVLSQYFRTNNGKWMRDNCYLQIPIVKKVVINVAAARFSRTLANLIGSGLPLINSLEITSRVVNSVVIEKKIADMRDDIRTGMSLSYGVKKMAVFPPIVHSMIAIGEESGNIDNLLNKLSDYMDDEVATSIERLMALMEPFLIILLGGSIGTIVVSMILPIFGIYDTIR